MVKRSRCVASQVSRLSLDAAGTSWGPIQQVQAEAGTNIGNALPIADLVTGELFLFFCHNNADLFLTTTMDGGGCDPSLLTDQSALEFG